MSLNETLMAREKTGKKSDSLPSGFRNGRSHAWDTRYLAPLICLLLALGLLSWIDHQRKKPFDSCLNPGIPETIGEWRGSDLVLEPEVVSMLSADVTIYRQYRHPNGREMELFWIAYSFQGEGKTMHSPHNCLPAAGWDVKEKKCVEVDPGLQAGYLLLNYGDYCMETIYWFVAGDDVVCSEYENKLKTLWNSIRSGRSDGALVSISAIHPAIAQPMQRDLVAFARMLKPYWQLARKHP
jgi:EpsI family protein